MPATTTQYQQLQTERLLLAQLDVQHTPKVLTYLMYNRTFFKHHVPTWTPDFFSIHFQRNQLTTQTAQHQRGELSKFFLFRRSDQQYHRIIGDITFSPIIRGSFMSCCVDCKLDKDYLQKGLMTEALSQAIQHIFETEGLHRMEAHAMPSNEAAIRLFEKLGFSREGFSPRYLHVNGQWEGHFRYALLREERPL